MRLDIKNNTKRSVVAGLLVQIIDKLLPFVVRTVFIRTLGSEFLGLGSLFTSILSVLSLAELGVGSAMVFFMYKPLAEDDYDSVKRLLNLYKIIYRFIGLAILIIGALIAPFLTFIISGSYPNSINIYIVYFIQLSCTLTSYFLFAYKGSVLSLHQRNDLISIISLVIKVFVTIIQIVSLLLFRNYYIYVLVIPISSLISNLITCLLVNIKYPQLRGENGYPNKEIRSEIKKKVSALFLLKIGYVVSSSFDNVIISTFLGLVILGKYSNYYYIITTITAFLMIVYNAIKGGLGNYAALHTKEETFNLFKRMSFLQHWLIIVCSVCFVCLFQPFVALWAGDDMLLPNGVAFLLSFLFLLERSADLISIFKDATGQWYEDKWRPLIGSIINLVVNIILVQFIGIYGIIISTIVSDLIVTPWFYKSIHKHFFDKPSKYYFLMELRTLVLGVGLGIITYFLCNLLPFGGFVGLIARLSVCLIVPNVVLLALFYKTKEFKEAYRLALNLLKK